MEEVVLFILSYIFIFIIYQIFLVSPAKKRKLKSSKRGAKKELVEIRYLVSRYKLDMSKISYNQLLQIVALVSSFDISLVVSVILRLDNFILEIVGGFVLTLIVILLSYHFVYLFYKKKGMIIND